MAFGKSRSLEHMEWRFVSKRLLSWLSLLWQSGSCGALERAHPVPGCQCLQIRGQAGAEHRPQPPRDGQGSQNPGSSSTWAASALLLEGFASTSSHRDRKLLTGEGAPESLSSFPVAPQEEHEASKLSAAFKKNLLFSNPKNRNAPGAPQRHKTSLQAAGGQAAPRDRGHGRGNATPSPVPATPSPVPATPALFAGTCESPGREEQSFVSAPGRRHVPAHCINIYSPHSYLLFDISHGPRPPRPPLGH